MLENYIKTLTLWDFPTMCFPLFSPENDLSCASSPCTRIGQARIAAQFSTQQQKHREGKKERIEKSFHTFFIFISPFNKFLLWAFSVFSFSLSHDYFFSSILKIQLFFTIGKCFFGIINILKLLFS